MSPSAAEGSVLLSVCWVIRIPFGSWDPERVQAGTDERAKPGIIGTFVVVSLDEQAHPDAASAGDNASAEGRERQCADHRGKLSAEQGGRPMTGPSLDEEPGNEDRRDYT